MTKSLKLKWANKVLRSRYFVVLTDKQSVIAVDGANPESMTDQLALQAQHAAIKDFWDKLGGLVKRHERAIAKLNKHTKTASKRTTTKAKKITVRED